MSVVTITEKGCRGCSLCLEICPTDVFGFTQATQLAQVERAEDCIGCKSCFYICPSNCVVVSETHVQYPFYRVEKNVALVNKFLQEEPAEAAIPHEAWEMAHHDVNSTMVALVKASLEVMGRGIKALGRKSGAIAAAHMPEMYEAKGLPDVLTALQQQFRNSFDFDFQIDNGQATLTFRNCGLIDTMGIAGEKIGEAHVCRMFHDYIAGLVSAYMGENYLWEPANTGNVCQIRMRIVTFDAEAKPSFK